MTGPPAAGVRTSAKAARFTESVIREMTRLAMAHGAVNLAQGFPDFAAPALIKDAAAAAIAADLNQYAVTWGAAPLRQAIADDLSRRTGVLVDPDRHVTVCCGATEAMVATLLAIVDPGDEVIVFEPFYENYGPDAVLAGATPRYVTLRPPDRPGDSWAYDPAQLRAAFTNRTRAIIVNTPNNPTGKVFSRAELEEIAGLCRQWDVVAVTDEIYEHITFDDAVHVPMAALDGMDERTVTINSASKTFSVTGWRVGWAVAPAGLTGAIRKVHDFLTVGAAAPLQAAVATALAAPGDYFEVLRATYAARRDQLAAILTGAGLRPWLPEGAYYIMTDASPLGWTDGAACARWLVSDVGVAAVPGSSFFANPARGGATLRFCFCKREETLATAGERLAGLAGRRS